MVAGDVLVVACANEATDTPALLVNTNRSTTSSLPAAVATATTKAPTTTKTASLPVLGPLSFAEEGLSVMLFSEDEASMAPGNLIQIGLVVAADGVEVEVEALLPSGFFWLIRLDEASTQLYITIPRQHTAGLRAT